MAVITPTSEGRVHTLEEGQRHETLLYRFKMGWILQFRVGPSLFGKTVTLSTNYPGDATGAAFKREKYRVVQWANDSHSTADDTGLYANLHLTLPGSFHYRFSVTQGGVEDLQESCGGSGYFVVDPTLPLKDASGSPVSMDGLLCQTVLAKNLGPFSGWRKILAVTKETGYNMVHFTPIQALGGSNSCYSLQDQLKVNPAFDVAGKPTSLEDIHELTQELEKQGVMSITDIVLNHTSNDSPWLQDHPEATYNLINSPHLRPAYILDRAIHYTSVKVQTGALESSGIPAHLNSDHGVECLRSYMRDQVFPLLRLHEFYCCHVDNVVSEYRKFLLKTKATPALSNEGKTLQLMQDPEYRRLNASIDLELAKSAFALSHYSGSDEERVGRSCESLRTALESLNQQKYNDMQGHLDAAVNGTIGTVRYERLDGNGPRHEVVSAAHPLVPQYFTHPGVEKDAVADEALAMTPKAAYVMAHNGWVMNHDPLKNFADDDCFVYLRRELVAWGDSVKLRYGSCASDSPYLWQRMTQYCQYTAKLFHGIRLDNCHSTPLHVAEHLLDCARIVRPDLYVIAELFTSSEATDNLFVNRLGINSLIREAMSAPSSHELGRLVYRYGGEPVGAFLQPSLRPLVPSVAHAMFLDVTHDNPSPVQTRTALDLLPSAALVSMACCASGSTRGYDELVPHHIHVVDETRFYPAWGKAKGEVHSSTGIVTAKKVLNDLHATLAAEGFCEVFVDQVSPDVVTVTRHNPHTHDTVILVAYTAFHPHSSTGQLRPLKVEGQLSSVLFEMEQDADQGKISSFVRDTKHINGLHGVSVCLRQAPALSAARLVRQTDTQDSDVSELPFTERFRPGCVVGLRFRMWRRTKAAAINYQSMLAQMVPQGLDMASPLPGSALEAALGPLDLVGLNTALYRCEPEESEATEGRGLYDVPGWGRLVYGGLQGLESALAPISANNDLGHPICDNLRAGDWLMDYTADRLMASAATKPLGEWVACAVSEIRKLPRFLVPAHFSRLLALLHLTLAHRLTSLLVPFVASGSAFVRRLAHCSAQFVAVVPSAPLPALSSALHPPPPAHPPTIAAGLPHFATGYMRVWGRDTFIALPGTLLLTGRYAEARAIILAFGGTLRHGMIPNLLDGGRKARYNCRDAVWWWLLAIKSYVTHAPSHHRILRDTVSRLFPSDDSSGDTPVDMTLEDVIHEAMTTHFRGLKFRERNAGFSIDDQMVDAGFNNEIGVDLNTGFPFGGNRNNCGTWMDKMGSSEVAGNKGRPATPRDGSAVEIVGLCKAATSFLAAMHKEGHFRHDGVTRIQAGSEVSWSYQFWASQIQANFSKKFLVTSKDPQPELVNRVGIYKDSVGSSYGWTDYQLRCNFPIALAVAPELVDPTEGLAALDIACKHLLGPVGVKTLDPSDWNYRPNYHNSDDSNDYTVARGFNYHQGPEWVWPVGYLLRARLALANRLHPNCGQEGARVRRLLAPHYRLLTHSPHRSLPELTNSGGETCHDSNPAQSWSTACVLEVLWDMQQLAEAQ